MLTSKQILELITARRGGVRGRVEALLRSLEGGAPGAHRFSDQAKFLRAFRETEREKRDTYAHPERRAQSVPLDPSRQGDQRTATLAPVDIAWLQRLPADPAQVTYADAVQLASFARTIPNRTADRRLLDAVWLPVKEVHDLKAAEVELANARQPLPEVPQSAFGALVEAVRAETSELSDDEMLNRASTLLKDTLDKRSAERDERIAAAESQISALRQAQEQRQALTA
jgi:hypothetical protein